MKAGIAGAATAGTGSNGQERLGALSYLGYAGGDFANNLTFSLTSLFLLIYYTDVAGIAAEAAGTVLVVAASGAPSPMSSSAGWSIVPIPGGQVPPVLPFRRGAADAHHGRVVHDP